MRLLTVSPDAALDRTLSIPRWRKGHSVRASRALERAGGKGLNVARAATALGLAVTAVAPIGGPAGEHLRAVAESEGLDGRWVWLDRAETPTSVVVIDPDEPSTTVIEEIGPTLTEDDWARLAALVRSEATQSDVTALCGDLPQGIPANAFGALLDSLMADGRALAVDASGEALAQALRRPIWLVKASHDAFGEVLGRPVDSLESAVEASKAAVAAGPRTVIVTFGAGSALCVRSSDAWWVQAPEVQSVNWLGSEDSLLAGVIAGRLRGENWPQPLVLGAACGAADALTLGHGLIYPDEVKSLRSRATVRHLS